MPICPSTRQRLPPSHVDGDFGERTTIQRLDADCFEAKVEQRVGHIPALVGLIEPLRQGAVALAVGFVGIVAGATVLVVVMLMMHRTQAQAYASVGLVMMVLVNHAHHQGQHHQHACDCPCAAHQSYCNVLLSDS